LALLFRTQRYYGCKINVAFTFLSYQPFWGTNNITSLYLQWKYFIDKGDGYLNNNFGQDLRNFKRFVEFAKKRGATTVYFRYGWV